MQDARYAEFVAALARHATAELPSGSALAESSLADLGFDSMSSINLLLDLEETFGLVFGEEQLSAETFSTPGALWKATAALLAARAQA